MHIFALHTKVALLPGNAPSTTCKFTHAASVSPQGMHCTNVELPGSPYSSSYSSSSASSLITAFLGAAFLGAAFLGAAFLDVFLAKLLRKLASSVALFMCGLGNAASAFLSAASSAAISFACIGSALVGALVGVTLRLGLLPFVF